MNRTSQAINRWGRSRTTALLAAFAGLVALSLAASADSRVYNTSMKQVNSQIVEVNYTLREPAVVTLDILTNATGNTWASIGGANITNTWGDVGIQLPAGNHALYWAADDFWSKISADSCDVKAEVRAYSTDSPADYMVIDLRDDTTRAGAHKIRYFNYPDQLPGGVTDRIYKTDFLVMRKIPAKGETFRMGSPSGENGKQAANNGAPNGTWNNYAGWNQETAHQVTLTNDFYLGVYELTRMQCVERIGKGNKNAGNQDRLTGKEAVPVGGDNSACAVNFEDFRGMTYLWPENGHQVTEDSALDKLRAKTGIEFDLPTEAQWEFACRAGTTSALYNGHEIDPVTSTSDGRNEYVDELAWHMGNSGQNPQEVGQKVPNAFGLYDILGNVGEFVLDRHTSDLGTGAVTEPVGATSGDTRVVKGGCITRPAFWCRAAFRQNYVNASTRAKELGFRLWAPVSGSANRDPDIGTCATTLVRNYSDFAIVRFLQTIYHFDITKLLFR